MIDQARLDAISLRPRPLGQRVFAWMFLAPNFYLPGRRTRILVEGEENIPRGGGAIFVMNHTDRYNYWPFQYHLHRRGLGYTATWVKGKYYESRAMGWFMDACGNIPLPSKGYVIAKDFQQAMARPPEDDEYRALKRLAEGALDEPSAAATSEGLAAFLARPWPTGGWAADVEARFSSMMRRVVAINQEALALGLNLLIFPQGTRSIRLTRGHTGAAQVILKTGAPVVPVGCNGSDRLYPKNSPWSRGGTVTYRIGSPLTVAGELARFRIDEPFTPFATDAERHQPTFRALTDLLMDRIDALLDPPYRYAGDDEDGGSDGAGARRFL